jgi:hypothetical protein
LVAEIASLEPEANVRGYWAKFVYQIFGRSLRASLYPARAVLYRKSAAVYVDEGHTQRVRIGGALLALTNPIYHDDRKSTGRWFNSQVGYVSLAGRLLMGDRESVRPIDHVRLLLVPAPH